MRTSLRPLENPSRQYRYRYQHFTRHYTRITNHPRPAQPQPVFTYRPSSPKRSAIDPLYILAFGVISIGLWETSKFFAPSTELKKDIDEQEGLPPADNSTLARLARLYPRTMAVDMPPGRPGTLTPEQETKLKEMWLAVFEVFGVAHESPQQSNGTSTPSSDSTSDAKKKKKSRLSLFKKDKSSDAGADSSNGPDNDKHGQTKEFQQAIASQSPESLRQAFWSMSKHDHPDALLLRFLRARKWDVQAALIMMISTMHWRSTEMHVDDDIMIKGEEGAMKESSSAHPAERKEGEDFLEQMRMGKSFLHGTDKDGRPCCWVRARLHRQGEQSERSLERFTVYTIETARVLLRPPVDTAVSVLLPAISVHANGADCRPSSST